MANKVDAINLERSNYPWVSTALPAQTGIKLVIARGPQFRDKYCEDTSNLIFWRGDTRSPDQVFKTGFSSRTVRLHNQREIVWRNENDDIIPATAVCLSRDIRGAMFFPYPDYSDSSLTDSHYIYAINVPRAASTYKIQQVAEKAETNRTDHLSNWRNKARFKYDPTWTESDNASCIWQFAEYAVHEVKPENILAGWTFQRKYLVGDTDDERGQAGIQFRLLHDTIKRRSNSDRFVQAFHIAKTYYPPYPSNPDLYLSYMGIVYASNNVDSTAAAKGRAKQIEAIVTSDDSDFNDRKKY